MMETATLFSEVDSYVVPASLGLIDKETYFSSTILLVLDHSHLNEFPQEQYLHRRTEIENDVSELDRSLAEDSHMSPEALQLQRCLSEIQQWLGVGLNFATKLSGISRSTYYAWRHRGSTPRQSTLASVFSFHAIVKYSVRMQGIDSTREIFSSGKPSYIQLILNSKNPDELSSILLEIRRELFRPEIPETNTPLMVIGKESFRTLTTSSIE